MEYRNSRYNMILTATTLKLRLSIQRKGCMRQRFPHLLQRPWLGCGSLQRSHCGALLIELTQNLPPGTCWGCILPQALHYKITESLCWESWWFCWPLYTCRIWALRELPENKKPFPLALSSVSLQCPLLTKFHMVQLSKKTQIHFQGGLKGWI